MASYLEGYDEERFETTINRNFLCLICFNVLRDPVECSRNKHCFCRACITKFLVNSQRCPTCADELTAETLVEPSRIVKDYLNELNIHCKHVNRGCHAIVQLQHLDRHEATCGFTPVVCTNQGCGVTINKRDQTRHETELCESQKLKYGEVTKTLEDLEKRMTNVETNMKNIENNMEQNKADMEGKLQAVNNEVKGLKKALLEGFNEMKEVLVKLEDMKKENTRKVRGRASGDQERECIIVAGGNKTTSVEIFNWRENLWSPLQSFPEKRYGATSFIYNSHFTVAGGDGSGHGSADNMIRMNIDPKPDVTTYWSGCPFKLPGKLAFHSSALYNDQLLVTGGENGCLGATCTSDCVDEVQLVPPYTVKTLSRMPEPRRGHGAKLFDDNLLIVGGRTTYRYQDCLSSVLLYDITKKTCKQLAPLPYEVSQMATVRWRDNIVVIGGVDKHTVLNKVLMYNVKTAQHHMLPPMKCKRWGCTAVVIGNNIVVLGGRDARGHDLKSVETFNFDHNSWEELPEMSEGRCWHTAVVV